MTTRDEVRELLETLAEEQLAEVLEFLQDMTDSPENALPRETRESLERGLRDIRNGDTATLTDYLRSRSE